jgi:hypothetical protein
VSGEARERATVGTFWAGGGMIFRIRDVWEDGYSVEVVLRGGTLYKRPQVGFVHHRDFANQRMRQVEDPSVDPRRSARAAALATVEDSREAGSR